MKIKIFCDSADFKTIKKLNASPLVSGFTTNPSLMRISGARNYKKYSLRLLRVCSKKAISLEVFADTPDQMRPKNNRKPLKGIARLLYLDKKAKLSKAETLANSRKGFKAVESPGDKPKKQKRGKK